MHLPAPLLSSLETVPGFDRGPFEAVHASGEQVTSIRFNPFKSFADDRDWGTCVPWCEEGRYLGSRPSFTLDPLFHAGAYYVQEASSMFLRHVLSEVTGTETHKKVLDLCAAPGGKSTLLAGYFHDGLVVANEVIKPRASVLVENITKWGGDDVIVTNNDPSHFQALPAFFDMMVVDAPCSGSGLFRKDPEAIAEWSEDAVQLCSQRQQRILADALPALKEEGILIYATCSYSPAEDEMIADWLVEEMDMETVRIPFPSEWGIVETLSFKKQAAGYRFYPDKIRGEGFFISVFRRRSGETGSRLREQQLTPASKDEAARVQSFIPLSADMTLFKQADAIRYMRKQWLNNLQQLAQALYIKKAGTEIGTIKGKDLIPSHELAMGLLPLAHFSSIDADKETALAYLRRKDLTVSAPTGWNLVRFGGLPLGWIKALPNRINNYYPSGWRILKD